MAESLRGVTIEVADIYLSYQEYKQMIQLEPNFDKPTHTKRTERLGDHHLDRHIVDLLLKTCHKLNIIRAFKGSLPSVASGINNYIRFCTMVRRPFFPVDEDTAELWSATFNPGKTFKIYRAHLQKRASCLTYQLIGYRRLS